jgi:hypothetical protein
VTRPQYAPVPRGYVRVWVCTIGTTAMGWIYSTRKEAEADARWNESSVITPLDVPAGAIPGLAATRGRRTK